MHSCMLSSWLQQLCSCWRTRIRQFWWTKLDNILVMVCFINVQRINKFSRKFGTVHECTMWYLQMYFIINNIWSCMKHWHYISISWEEVGGQSHRWFCLQIHMKIRIRWYPLLCEDFNTIYPPFFIQSVYMAAMSFFAKLESIFFSF